MFYTKQMELMESSTSNTNEYGISCSGYLSVFCIIDCDLQPINKELALKKFGTEEDVKYRVFCDAIGDLKIGSILTYQEKLYRVITLIEWDDYMEFIVGDYDGV